MSFKKVLLLACATLLLVSCKTELYTGLSEREVNEMLAVLIENGISSSKEVSKDKTSTLLVEEGDFAKAVSLLKRNGLPRTQFENIGQIFKKEGLISSPMEERARFAYGLSQELSDTISQIDGVLQARVQVVLPENFSPLERNVPSSASVFIRHKPDANISKLSTQIKLLVTNSVEGLVYDKVSVALFPADDQSTNSDSAMAANAGNRDDRGTMSMSSGGSAGNYTSVAGFRVHEDSANSLLLTLYLLGGLAIMAILTLVFLLFGRSTNSNRPQLR
ncbi:EscJ/YscJ/HrcJ family type III secretion inner membrane ring protein [Chromatiales bacterium (ex Bugula neritina AB1)]|nr:EscJ/YscJ/HrcJ family type III secretion inner membrane ring protein [Chromatiales bacterium (ex Bugula neritina AB1)]